MAEPEQAIPEAVMSEARAVVCRSMVPKGIQDDLAHDVAMLLLSAEARGRAAQREADARIVEEMALVMAQGWESTSCSGKCMASTGLHNAGFFIATAIRKQENKT